MASQADIEQLVSTIPLTEKGNLACPFCGSVVLSRLTARRDADLSWIECATCGATGPNSLKEIGWNARAFGRQIYMRVADFEQLSAQAIPARHLVVPRSDLALLLEMSGMSEFAHRGEHYSARLRLSELTALTGDRQLLGDADV